MCLGHVLSIMLFVVRNGAMVGGTVGIQRIVKVAAAEMMFATSVSQLQTADD